MGQQKGNPTPSYQNQAYEALRPNTGARENRNFGMAPVMISHNTTLDNVIDSSSLGVTSGYAKDTDLTDGSINARFDTLTANEYHVTILSSSIMYANGSNVFGDSADDKHQFTGSILIGGGELSIRLNQATASLQAHSASVDAQLARIYQATASLQAHSASVDAQLARIYQTTGSLNTYTGSNDTTNTTQNARLTSLEISTGSINTTIGAVSSSLSGRLTITGSCINDAAAAVVGVPIGGLYHTTGTVKVRLT